MKKAQKRLLIYVLVLFLGLVFIGCGSNKKREETLNFASGLEEAFNDYEDTQETKRLIDEYNDLQDIIAEVGANTSEGVAARIRRDEIITKLINKHPEFFDDDEIQKAAAYITTSRATTAPPLRTTTPNTATDLDIAISTLIELQETRNLIDEYYELKTIGESAEGADKNAKERLEEVVKKLDDYSGNVLIRYGVTDKNLDVLKYELDSSLQIARLKAEHEAVKVNKKLSEILELYNTGKENN